MSGCGNCSGNCGGCSGCTGCGGAMELSRGEVDMLLTMGQIPFLPVARKMGEDIPVYLEDDRYTPEDYSLILQCLEKKSLIRIDYDAPLRGADMTAYAGFPVHGSISLTQRGYTVLELLETQGID